MFQKKNHINCAWHPLEDCSEPRIKTVWTNGSASFRPFDCYWGSKSETGEWFRLNLLLGGDFVKGKIIWPFRIGVIIWSITRCQSFGQNLVALPIAS